MTTKKENPWEGFPGTYQEKGLQKLWRTHSDAVNQALLIRWLSGGQTENLLKTDLFDEAVNDGLYWLLTSLAKKIVFIDVSFEVIQMARSRFNDLVALETDVRCLTLANHTFDVIVSISTLDHFKSMDEIVIGLRELYRVLRPGGKMILTLDNLANPIVLLRNKLPFRLLNRLGIVPYYVGVTLGPNRLKYLLEETGFKVLEVDAIMHCPRVLAVAIARWIERYASPKTQRYFLHFLKTFESLSRLPTRFFTGYFIAVKTTKP